MVMEISKIALGLGVAIALCSSSPSVAAGSHRLNPNTPNNQHGGLGTTPTPPVHTNPYVVPYSCGSVASSVYTHNSLVVKSDTNGDAGFKIYSSQSPTNVPFAPGVLTFNVSGAHNGDQIVVVEENVNGLTNGTSPPPFLNNGQFSINLTQLTTANIREVAVLIVTTNSTIVLNNFQLNSHALPVDLTQTAHCSSN